MPTSESGLSIVLASRNLAKSAEIRELLAPVGISVVSVAEAGDVPEIVEDGTTFAENAAKKAGETAKILSRWSLGEDSGLMVDALDGAPGIFSARYSGPDATDETNNAKLIAKLADTPEQRRTARYVCSIAVADPKGAIRLQVEAGCRGRIISEKRGPHGFGYDPLFLIPEYHRTFGELGPTVKHRLSHRARAFEQLVPALAKLVGTEPTSA
jgi:XTP/dITP diphosphohydrolase